MKKNMKFIFIFFFLFIIGLPSVSAVGRGNIWDFVPGGSTWVGQNENGNMKQEITSVTFNASSMVVDGTMFKLASQNYENAGDHEYYMVFKGGGNALYFPGAVTNVSRTKTHRDKAGNGNQFTYEVNGNWEERCSQAEVPTNQASTCDVHYEQVGFHFEIPLSELMGMAENTGISAYLILHEKTTNKIYEDAMTTLQNEHHNQIIGDYVLDYNTSIDNANATVIEEYVFLRRLAGLGGDTTNDDQICYPEIANCNDVGRQFYAAGYTYRVLSGYRAGAYAGGRLADQQGAYQLAVNYAYKGNVSSNTVTDVLGDYKDAYIAASAVRIPGGADLITLRPNKKTWIDETAIPTQECDANGKLLIKAHCDPCGTSGVMNDEVTVNYGGVSRKIQLNGLTSTPKNFETDINIAACQNTPKVDVTLRPETNPGGGLDTSAYKPSKENLIMSCSEQDKQRQSKEGIVLTKKIRGGAYSEYKEKVTVSTADGPEEFEAGRGFEYPVGYEYELDAEVRKPEYQSLFKGKFDFNPKTKFYTMNLTEKVDEAYPKKSVSEDNPDIVSDELRRIYTSREQPYTVPYDNENVSLSTLAEQVRKENLGIGKLTMTERVLSDPDNDGKVTNTDTVLLQQKASGGVSAKAAVLPQTWIEKGSGHVYNTEQSKRPSVIKPLEDGGNKVYTNLNSKRGKYFFSVSGASIGLNQFTFVLPKCDYYIKCNPIAEVCSDTPDTPGTPETPVPPGTPERKAVFRIISLSDPFPGRQPGANWVGHEGLIKTGAYTSRAEYSIHINSNLMRTFTDYNRDHSYLNYNTFEWDAANRVWRSSFVGRYVTRGV